MDESVIILGQWYSTMECPFEAQALPDAIHSDLKDKSFSAGGNFHQQNSAMSLL